MKILVCISKTPDTTAKIAFTDNNTKFAEAGVQWILNPYDEWYALVRAIEIKEKDTSTLIHLVNIGGTDAEPIIRKAFALGGDEAIRGKPGVRWAQANFPSRIEIARTVPRAFPMYANPASTTAGNSIRWPRPRLQTVRNGGCSRISAGACVRAAVAP